MGIRDGLEVGKEDTLQEGFDLGFAEGAERSFRFGKLRGALSAAAASGLFSSINSESLGQARACLKQLRTLEMDTSVHKDGEKVDAASTEEADATVTQAHKLLKLVGMDLSE
ncbi:hypothetical protein PHYSODRAFT_298889 [Phytophthora sojae]|uniref:Essential protein Yae1 N-terminal domain-containing protein n=1 Tax=Phytophthora sojae (strain P6497) TaxID=1094619 RepID=G4Z644_PHYSP|nr:hypothetical protein PHYSODRAFT_298889 [Phytophthora sojae]EGZ20965.1 hypothetical protein PHYSODRAFT_298889 [Phytophthora sojae]|eukprot:XP_009523682.1 hypothetical protein PHYSODRAFT_298889 [Phytophthora sojae]